MPVTADARSLVCERMIPQPPERVWRALTQPWLIEQWLMANDFRAEVGHCFTLRAAPLPGWAGFVNCEVLVVDPPRRLAYRWGDGSESDIGLVTTVTWTLEPEAGGTMLRMEQAGFRPGDDSARQRLGEAWPRILARLESVTGEAG